MQEPVEKYVNTAKDDLRAARLLLKKGMPFFVPFFCHQALQKILRGYYLESLNRYPPLTNDLLLIADDTEAGLRMDEPTREFVASLCVYPEVIGNPVYRKKIVEKNDEDRADAILNKASEIVEMVRVLIG